MIKVYTGDQIPQNEKGIFFPCENIHPKEVVSFAQKIVQYGTNLIVNHNVKDIMIITYNPVLIEALDTWSKYYEVEDKIDFYLNNKPIARYMGDRMMCYIYDNLTMGYDLVDEIKAEILFRC